MPEEFRLPKLGEDTESAEITKLLVAVGDTVKVDQPLFEIETDKATVEVPSTLAGKITEILVAAGSEIKEGQVILKVDTGAKAEQMPEEPKPEPPSQAAEEKPAPEPAPESQEAPVEVEAPAEKPEKKIQPQEETPAATVAASPLVRKFAHELGVDINRVHGSGEGGRVSMEDVKQHVRDMAHATGTAAPEVVIAHQLPDFEKWGPVRREPMSNIRRRTAQRLSLSWSQIPHVTHFDRADITELERERKHLARKVEESGTRLTITIILTRIVAAALKSFPKFNASVDMANRAIVFKDYCHIGIAADTERGLLVPVVKDADKKNLLEISKEIGALSEKARTGTIQPDDLKGGTFTLTNLGSIGGTHFTPIINYPQVAILGVGRGYKEANPDEDECRKTRLVLPLSLSYDHRLIDGAEAARFLRWIVQALEEPLMLQLGG